MTLNVYRAAADPNISSYLYSHPQSGGAQSTALEPSRTRLQRGPVEDIIYDPADSGKNFFSRCQKMRQRKKKNERHKTEKKRMKRERRKGIRERKIKSNEKFLVFLF